MLKFNVNKWFLKKGISRFQYLFPLGFSFRDISFALQFRVKNLISTLYNESCMHTMKNGIQILVNQSFNDFVPGNNCDQF